MTQSLEWKWRFAHTEDGGAVITGGVLRWRGEFA